MIKRLNHQFLNYLIIVLGAALAAGLIFSSQWRSGDHYASKEQFIGCYQDRIGNTLELMSNGQILQGEKQVGTYQILSPVPGKHGFIVEAIKLNLNAEGERFFARPGSGGFLWPVSTQGELTVLFAPDSKFILNKARSCEK